MTKRPVKLLICGDIIPTPANEQAMMDGRYTEIVGDLLDVFGSADFRFCNLEGVLTERGIAINKGGPNIRANPKAGRILADLGIDLAGLANNHSLDWGKEGLTDTFTTLRSLGIRFTGAGYNLADARVPFRMELGGNKISIITVAEHEYTIAQDDRSGANPFDPFDTIDDIRAEKAAGYTVVVIYHGGKEHYPLTSPETRKRCRQMAKHGADFVFCQHTHCVCCCEEYDNCFICYGQGNTLFTKLGGAMPECWKTSIIPMITVDPDGKNSVEYIPITVEPDKIRLAKGDDYDAIMNGFWERSAKVLDDKAMAESWEEFYMQNGAGMLKQLGVLNADLTPKDPIQLKLLKAIMECEIHHESALSAIKNIRIKTHGKEAIYGE